jgi:hypothetical protein
MLDPEMRLFRQRREADGEESAPVGPASDGGMPWAEPSWLAWQTLTYSGAAQIKTAGVTHYETNFRAVRAEYGRLVMAELRVEHAGQYAGAVRVYVGGKQLGSVPHGSADEFRAVIGRLAEAGVPATCRADLDVESGGYVDVWLCGKARERTEDDPFLPPMLGERLSLAEDVVAYLDDAILGSRAKSKRVVRTAELVERDGLWTVMLDGRELGVLAAGDYARLEEAGDAGFPVTCQVRVRRQPGRPLRVDADFPTC